MQSKLLNICTLFLCFFSVSTIEVSTVEELHKALDKARAGQTIEIRPGVYDFSTYERRNSFSLSADGEELSPITLTAQNPYNPPILTGPNLKDGYILNIVGNYWVLNNIKIVYGGKGIVLENASYNIIKNVEIFSIGAQGILIRDGSSHNLVQNCYIHNTGIYDGHYGLYGEGIEIGNPIEHSRYNFKNDYNIIEGCIFRHTSCEHINIREYNTGNEVFKNAFYGDGMNGRNEANCFISISGNENYIHDNVGYRNDNKNIVAAFKVKKSVDESGERNKFMNNVLYMNRPYGEIDTAIRIYIVDGGYSKFSVKNNKIDYGDGLLDGDDERYYNFTEIE